MLAASIIAPILVGACVAATATHTRDVTHATRDATETEVRVSHATPPAADQPTDAAVSAEPAAVPLLAAPLEEPVHEVEDKPEPEPVSSAPPFTRVVERAWIEARGAPSTDAAVLSTAVVLDNAAWVGDQRQELLTYLRGGIVDGSKDAAFTDADARSITQLQSGSGATVDGVIGGETMAIFLATGFRFSPRKATPGQVKLEFYPSELEDLDAWNLEIEEKVTKKGGGFRDVNAPPGEGTIYVYVGRSIVARYRGRGGPPSPLVDGPKHVALPTTPGTYRLGPGQPHVTTNWYDSQIPWGAEIRKSEDGYQYRWPGQTRWLWATRHAAGTLKEPFGSGDFEDLPEVIRDGVTYLIWDKNDFGPIAWNLVPSDQYLHTTPRIEAETAVAKPGDMPGLGFSHGCIRVDPRDRDEMVKLGYLGKDIRFVVRRWDEHLLPEVIRRKMTNRTVIQESSQ